MVFHFSVVRGPAARPLPPGAAVPGFGAGAPGQAEQPWEITVDLPAGASGEALAAALGSRLGRQRFTVGGLALPGLTVGTPPLVDGAVLVCGGAPGSAAPRSGLFLVVLGGPDAGRIFPAGRGLHRVGRSADIRIRDPALSRVQAELVVGASEVLLRNLSSAGCCEVDGRPVTGAVEVGTSSELRFGDSRCALRLPGQPTESTASTAATGQGPEEFLVVLRNGGSGGRPALLLSALVPLVAGTAVAAVTGMWMFLAFSGASALALLLPAAVGGARRRKQFTAALAAAAAEDARRRSRKAPGPGELLVRAMSGALRAPTCPEAVPVKVALRLGLGDQPAAVRTEPPDPGFVPPLLAAVPVIADLGEHRCLDVVGTPARTGAAVRALLMQLAASASAGPVIVFGAPAVLPLSARFLPGVRLVSRTDRLAAELATAGSGAVLVAVDQAPLPAPLLGPVAVRCAQGSLRLIRCRPDPAVPSQGPAAPLVLTLDGRPALAFPGRDAGGNFQAVRLVPDLVSSSVFDRFCRQVAARGCPQEASNHGVPDRCVLGDLMPVDLRQVLEAWRRPAEAVGVPVRIGCGADGPVVLDLCTDGPHFLVAGTTGAGKSVLLRTIVLSAALSQPPSLLTFLFLDFKGGAGLGPLQDLPHCAGLLTDLRPEAVHRALASLRAEVRRREALFAQSRCEDLADYRRRTPAGPALPRLVIVVDEFRALVDDVPGAMAELLRIAATGRSLGLHLLLATQRPQGAVSADIRANITTSIALRTQSALESIDVIGSGDAAQLAPGQAGRAFLKRAAQAPLEFQAAEAAALTATSRPVIIDLAEQLWAPEEGKRPDGDATDLDCSTDASNGVEALCSLLREAATAAAAPLPPQPVAPPLPVRLPFPARTPDGTTGTVRLGLLDVPARQRVDRLDWDPRRHPAVAMVGGPASGLASGLRLAVDQLAAGSAGGCHLYLLDGDGALARAAEAAPGTACGMEDPRRAARLLQLFAAEAERRRHLEGAAGGTELLTLVVSGWGHWLARWRNGPHAWAEDLVLDVARSAAARRCVLLVGGERELVSSRLFPALTCRLFLPFGSPPEARLAWPRLPDTEPAPGRGVAQGPWAPDEEAVAQLFLGPVDGWPVRGHREPPFRVLPLPDRFPASALCTADPPPGSLLVGVGGDDLEPVRLPLGPGEVLLAVGGAGTGKTALLDTVSALNAGCFRMLHPAPGEDAEGFWSTVPPQPPGTVALVDDADRLGSSAQARVAQLAADGTAVVATARPNAARLAGSPLLLQARRSGTGLILGAARASDGELFGVRPDTAAGLPPGRAQLVEAGTARYIQLAVSDRP